MVGTPWGESRGAGWGGRNSTSRSSSRHALHSSSPPRLDGSSHRHGRTARCPCRRTKQLASPESELDHGLQLTCWRIVGFAPDSGDSPLSPPPAGAGRQVTGAGRKGAGRKEFGASAKKRDWMAGEGPGRGS
ncbi:hypothetical protein DCS_07142 [Drechmeria coniospora]|uniref:Uncharacterized protein n=1 Tax=Drechmeria coniospora TaxID=98403 RepID=A0A151GDL5_DRECN|nr:hypothetical protein DCS_07142 [Drechmeria coniospora]KYK55180.1 hypothetical protein DCS_07142 [Drechmeria coniospora]